jgi:hypothetical protein
LPRLCRLDKLLSWHAVAYSNTSTLHSYRTNQAVMSSRGLLLEKTGEVENAAGVQPFPNALNRNQPHIPSAYT